MSLRNVGARSKPSACSSPLRTERGRYRLRAILCDRTPSCATRSTRPTSPSLPVAITPRSMSSKSSVMTQSGMARANAGSFECRNGCDAAGGARGALRSQQREDRRGQATTVMCTGLLRWSNAVAIGSVNRVRRSTDFPGGTSMPLDPAVKAVLDQLAAAGGPTLREAGVEQGRLMIQALAMMDAEPPDIARIEPLTLAGSIPARLYAASTDTPRPILVWYHGGGFVIGDLETADRTCRTLAAKTGALVLSVDYRLAS